MKFLYLRLLLLKYKVSDFYNFFLFSNFKIKHSGHVNQTRVFALWYYSEMCTIEASVFSLATNGIYRKNERMTDDEEGVKKRRFFLGLGNKPLFVGKVV